MLELGTGCGIVGITIASVIARANVLLTDLSEAQEIVERNIKRATMAKGSSLAFRELDWDSELPETLQSSTSQQDLIVAADCTYNPDSRYVLKQRPPYGKLTVLQSSPCRYARATGADLTRSANSNCHEDAPLKRRRLL